MSSFQSNTLESFEFKPQEKLPVMFDPIALAFRLGFTGKALWYAVMHRDSMYQSFKKPKASGGFRTLHNPNPFMRIIGKQLRRKLLLTLCADLGPHVTAYRAGQSTLDAAKRHLVECATCAPADGVHTCAVAADDQGHVRKLGTAGCTACAPVPQHVCPRKGVKIHMDLKDFFGSTRRSWIRNYIHQELGYSHQVAGLMATLLTVTLTDEKGRKRHGVPQGGTASGDITNLVADHRLDRPLLKALPAKWTYSRYADDIYLSCTENTSREETDAVLNAVREVVKQSGYRVNEKKTHVQRAHRQQRLLGVVLNQKLNIPRGEYRRMRAIIHRCWCDGFEPTATKMKKSSGDELKGWIEGKLSYYAKISPRRTAELKEQLRAATEKHQDTEMSFTFGKVVKHADQPD